VQEIQISLSGGVYFITIAVHGWVDVFTQFGDYIEFHSGDYNNVDQRFFKL